jgi:hypothetical protein
MTGHTALTLIRRIASTSALVLAMCVALVGCFVSDNHSIIWIENRTDTVVGVFLVRVGESDGSYIARAVQPGLGYSYFDIAEGCHDDLQLVAKDDDGVTIARSSPPLCRPSTWVIERQTPAMAPLGPLAQSWVSR